MSNAIAKSPTTDKRWQQLAARYRYNWQEASLDLFARIATEQQESVIVQVRETGCFVSIRSGHGTGKSDLLAQIALIYIICYPNSRVLLASNKLDQTLAGLVKYLRIHWLTLTRRFPWLRQYFEIGHKTFYAKCAPGVWGLVTKSFKPGLEEALAGEHGEHLLWILDEASAMPDPVFKVVTGSLTETDNRLVLLSQPTRQSGYFYDSHHKLAKVSGKPNGLFTAICLNSEESPLVTDKWLRMKELELGGRDSDDYLIKVRGEFAAGSNSGMLLSRDEVLRGQANKPLLSKSWGWLAVADVGDGSDKSVLVIGRVSGYGPSRVFIPVRVFVNNFKAVPFAGFINSMCSEALYPGISIAIDAGGVGSPCADLLNEAGRDVQRIYWGQPCFSQDDQKRFLNKRAAANVWTRDAILQGRMRLPPGELILDEASRIPISINERGQIAVMSKKAMRQQGISSPDLFDAFCYVSLADFNPHDRVVSEDVAEQAADMDREYRLMMGLADELPPEEEDADLWKGESEFAEATEDWDED